MNNTIYKYPLEITDEQVVMLPAYARLLTVQVQNDKPCLWAVVNPALPNDVPLTVYMFGTGHPIEDSNNMAYLATFQMYGGRGVFHVFVERKNVSVKGEYKIL